MAAPTNKIDFYQRYLKGEFGNRPRTWATWGELRDSDYRDKVTARDMVPGGPCHYLLEVDDLRKGIVPDGLDLTKARFNESMPDHRLTIQGNAWLDVNGLRLEYSRELNIGHRQAVRQPYVRQASGMEAHGLIKSLLWPADQEDLWELFERFPEAVIEFSSYYVPVGVLPHRRTVFWECRAY